MKYRTFDKIKNSTEFLLGFGTLAYIKTTEISHQFISGNIPDLLYPITNYTSIRATWSKKPSLPLAFGIAAIGTVAEFAQYFNLYHGTFDVKDIPMYFIGAGIAYGIDKITFNKKKADLENKL